MPFGYRLMIVVPAVSYWPEFYYDVLLGGKYFRVIDKMHERYGMWALRTLAYIIRSA